MKNPDLRVYGMVASTREQLEEQVYMMQRVVALLVDRLGGKAEVTLADLERMAGGKLTLDYEPDMEHFGQKMTISSRRRG